MANYAELMAQANALMAQAEATRKEERKAAIADIKEKMQTYGLTIADLGANGRRGRPVGSGTRVKGEAKYRGPNGELWSGGAGRRPFWVRDALAAGKDLSEFLIVK